MSLNKFPGSDEGAFAWVTVNYLLGNLGKPSKDTVGVIDLGGGSTQIMFAVPDEVAANAPKGYLDFYARSSEEISLLTNAEKAES